jgi:hypothetical protein
MMGGAAVDKARDADRKSLQRLGVTFEDYYNDYECYPPDDPDITGPSDGPKPYLI